MQKLLWTLCFIATASFGQAAHELLQSKLSGMKTMSANFKQTISAKKHALTTSSGKMALSRPGKFRWDTTDPIAQLVIADGKQLWVYDVDLEQVTVKPQAKNVGGTAGLFLSDAHHTVDKDFIVKERQQGKQQIFELKSRNNQANFQRVTLKFEGNILQELDFLDQLGQLTHVVFKKIVMNPTLKQNLFQFKVPRGVDVVK